MDEAKLHALIEKIRALVEAEVSAGRPYLLAKLGKDLGQDLILVRALGMTLTEFLQHHLADDFSVILTGQYSTIPALVRAEGENKAQIATPPSSEVSSGETKPPRFNPRFWAAFAVPLTAPVRYLNRHDLLFVDGSEPPGDNYWTIEPHLIAEANIPERDKAITSNINSWLEANELSSEPFMLRKKRTGDQHIGSHGGRSVLEIMIEALDKKQLAGTTLSLDVVAALMEKRLPS